MRSNREHNPLSIVDNSFTETEIKKNLLRNKFSKAVSKKKLKGKLDSEV